MRGSVWVELEEPVDELEPEGGLELDEPDFEPDALDDELEEDAGLAGVPSFAAMSNGPVTPGPKYFAVRS